MICTKVMRFLVRSVCQFCRLVLRSVIFKEKDIEDRIPKAKRNIYIIIHTEQKDGEERAIENEDINIEDLIVDRTMKVNKIITSENERFYTGDTTGKQI